MPKEKLYAREHRRSSLQEWVACRKGLLCKVMYHRRRKHLTECGLLNKVDHCTCNDWSPEI